MGCAPPATIPSVSIDDKNGSGGTSFYPTTNEIVIGSKNASTPDSYLWAYASPVLEGSLKPGGESYAVDVLSRYYQSSYLGSSDSTRFEDASNPKYNWYSVFWKIREAIGKDAADRLFVKALEEAGPREKEKWTLTCPA